MHSMTGYGQAAMESERSRVSVTIRTVNHKTLDIALRLPEDFRQEEARIRDHIGRHLRRGRVEIRFDIADLREHDVRIELNRALIGQLVAAIEDWKVKDVVVGELTLRDLIRIPDALRIVTESVAPDSEIVAQLFSALDQALSDTAEARRLEGEKLRRRISGQLDDMRAKTDLIDSQQGEIAKNLSERYRNRLEQLDVSELQLDESRVAQEIALLIERADIREEIDRLHTHVEHFRVTLDDDRPVGRRLDFLAQEMFRELTTLATKCRHLPVIEAAIDGKLICEQIREQVQNLE